MVIKRKDWYRHWFGNEYLTVYAHRDEEEARSLVNLIEKNIPLNPDHRIMDLCCGQGRHALLLASRGYRVVGVDLSRTLLELAKFNADPLKSPRFIQADMRTLPFSGQFDVLLNLFTSFGYFEQDRENMQVFEQFYQVLRPHGYFVFDYLNVQHVVENLVEYQSEQSDGNRIDLERKIKDKRVEKKITLNKDGRLSEFFESVKMYQPDEIFNMLKMAHLKIVNIFGDYSGIPYEINTPRLLIIGKKT